MKQPQGAVKRLTRGQRRDLDAVIDGLMDVRAQLMALIAGEPEGTRDLLLARLMVDQITVIIMDRYAEPVPPAPATTRTAASGEPGKKVA